MHTVTRSLCFELQFLRMLRMKMCWTFDVVGCSQMRNIDRLGESRAALASAGNGCFSSAAASAGVSASMEDERNTINESVGFGTSAKQRDRGTSCALRGIITLR